MKFLKDNESELNLVTYTYEQQVLYPVLGFASNEMSKCVLTGNGYRVSQKGFSSRDLDILDFVNKFKVCTMQQIQRYLTVQKYSTLNLSAVIYNLSRSFAAANIIKYSFTKNYADSTFENGELEVVSLMAGGLYLVDKFKNAYIEEDIVNYSQRINASNKRVGYGLEFFLRTNLSIETYLYILENYKYSVDYFDFRIKLKCPNDQSLFTPADVLFTVKESDTVQNYLMRGVSDMDLNDIDRYVSYCKHFNTMSEDQRYLNLHLPLSDKKARLILITPNVKVEEVYRSVLSEKEISTEYIDIISLDDMKQYIDSIFKDEKERECEDDGETFI